MGESVAGPVHVIWQDAWFDANQGGEDDWRDDYLVHTVGFVVRDTDDVLSIAMEQLPEGDGFRAVTHVPRGMIVSVRPLADRSSAGSTEGPARERRTLPGGDGP